MESSNTIFSNNRTIEQFKAEKKTAKLNICKAIRKDGSAVLHQDGKTTKRAVCDEAGNTIAWCSAELCRHIEAGRSLAGEPLQVVDATNKETGETYTSLCFAGQREIEISL